LGRGHPLVGRILLSHAQVLRGFNRKAEAKSIAAPGESNPRSGLDR
jgi:hypothetical protein